MQQQVYLDYNATCPIRDEVITFMTEIMKEGGNPSSVHASGRKARNRVENARRQVAALAGAKPQEVIFTSGGTEANNMVLNGFPDREAIISAGEHDSLRSVEGAKTIPLDKAGLVDLEALKHILGDLQRPALVSVMLANNETGVLQNISEIAELVHEYGVLLHTDAIQALGKITFNFKDLGADLMSLSSHKIGGPQGMGALVVRDGVVIKTLQKGGGQEQGRRGGTENVAGIAGFGLAAEQAEAELSEYARLSKIRDKMEADIEAITETEVFGKGASRLPNTSCIRMPGVPSELQVMTFDLNGFAVSAGSACSSGKVKASHVLTAMGYDDITASQSLRVSMGRHTTQEDADRFVLAWKNLYERKGAGR
ncbi:aminotransferase class V-fold PLP-dependent enzyme [Sneathiella sp. P13V-1]|uniref:cysteine desulfurase family protein n=1 Tax=Sneathiella sp. P13V-1 TaxID=2697366 RepID=UPI00187B7E6C|nr:cysteine desulfurase family protein [Sneathiella sp. P13V-1]MBE7637031.1 aminotransferase class V-fold PLP-dependent enzyme [Sneathiella sp. P13V-1]